jgi:hypothetical protein
MKKLIFIAIIGFMAGLSYPVIAQTDTLNHSKVKKMDKSQTPTQSPYGSQGDVDHSKVLLDTSQVPVDTSLTPPKTRRDKTKVDKNKPEIESSGVPVKPPIPKDSAKGRTNPK